MVSQPCHPRLPAHRCRTCLRRQALDALARGRATSLHLRRRDKSMIRVLCPSRRPLRTGRRRFLPLLHHRRVRDRLCRHPRSSRRRLCGRHLYSCPTHLSRRGTASSRARRSSSHSRLSRRPTICRGGQASASQPTRFKKSLLAARARRCAIRARAARTEEGAVAEEMGREARRPDASWPTPRGRDRLAARRRGARR